MLEATIRLHFPDVQEHVVNREVEPGAPIGIQDHFELVFEPFATEVEYAAAW